MRLIDAKRLEANIKEAFRENPVVMGIMLRWVRKQPTAADVAQVVHGRWVHTDLAYHWTSLDECSVCGYHDEKRRHLGDYSYCPYCGARMDGNDGG